MNDILKFTHTEAKAFFLKEESYFNFDLPKYFVFEELLGSVSKYIGMQKLSKFYSVYKDKAGNIKTHSPAFFDAVNYKFLNNRDGKFAWRPFQLIHPALYVSLVHQITEQSNWSLILNRFTEFRNNSKIRCCSIPVQSDDSESDKAKSINGWWFNIEQQSIELALKYNYVLHTDISDCYGSIYTHSVPWALHTKSIAKKKRSDMSMIGNSIDKHLQDMAYGQTNGIPQGSVLMDFIAEIILGYADLEMSEKLSEDGVTDYEIIRYRDDYRIFSNNPQICEHIAKRLTEILIDLGMRLNAQKTIVSDNVIRSSIKPDKYYWITARKGAKSAQKHLLLIHNLSEKYPNSGTLTIALNKFYDRLKNASKNRYDVKVLSSILSDIMFKNPKTYPIATAILSKLFSLMADSDEKNEILNLICEKFEKIPNTAHIKIWLQRLTIKLDRERNYREKLSQKVNDTSIRIWCSDWLENGLKDLIENHQVIDENTINNVDVIIAKDEVELFKSGYELEAFEILEEDEAFG